MVQGERPASYVVEYAPGGAYYDVHPFGEPAKLFAYRCTAVNCRDAQLALRVERQQLFRCLYGQFACRNENYGFYAVFRWGQQLQNGQPESGGFACAGLGLRYDVVGLAEQFRNGEFLNGGRAFEPFCPDGFEHALVKPQGAKIVG